MKIPETLFEFAMLPVRLLLLECSRKIPKLLFEALLFSKFPF